MTLQNKILKYRLAGLIARIATVVGLAHMLGRYVARKLNETDPGMPATPEVTVLALSPHRFRGDLSMLATTGRVRVIAMSFEWQTRILRAFFPEKIWGKNLHQPTEQQRKQQGAHQKFLRQFLRPVFDKWNVDVVIGADVRYAEDVDMGVTARHMGIPYVVFHRENLLAAREIYSMVTSRMNQMGHFLGTMIVVHNETCRQMFIDSGYATLDQVSALGAMRMDSFVEFVESSVAQQEKESSPTVCIFPFGHDREWFEYPDSIFWGAHQAFARFAQNHPEIQVIVKPKLEDAAKTKMLLYIDQALAEIGLDKTDLPNFLIKPELDAQTLIKSSRVVAGMDSTVVLEAAVAGRPVLIPYFDEIRCSPFEDRVKFHDDLHLFDTPRNADEMLEILEARYREAAVDHETMTGRKTLFEKFVSPLDGQVTERYIRLLSGAVER